MITDEIRTFLLADVDLLALLDDRITAISIAQETDLPALSFSIISNTSPAVQIGVSGLDIQRLRFHAYTETYDQMNTLTRKLRDRMELLSASIQEINSVQYLDEIDGELDTDLELFHRVIEFEVYFN